MAPTTDPQTLLPLTPAIFHIVLTLSGGERHGYAIMREVDRLTNGAMHLNPGTLYRSIQRMLDNRMIEESDERPDPELDDERRRYYRLTEFGQRVGRAEAQRLESLVNAARARRMLRKPRPVVGGA